MTHAHVVFDQLTYCSTVTTGYAMSILASFLNMGAYITALHLETLFHVKILNSSYNNNNDTPLLKPWFQVKIKLF